MPALSNGRVGARDVNCPDWRSGTGFTPGNGWGWSMHRRQPQGVTEMLSPGTFGTAEPTVLRSGST